MTNKWISFIKFALVGVVNTLIDFVVYALLTTIGVNYILAQWISYSAGILNSYVMNRKWTFERKEKSSKREVISFVIVNLITLSLTSFLLTVLYNKWGISLLISKLLITIASVGINFIGTKLFVFTTKKERGIHI
ncbi:MULTISPECIES: GtrA family protein [Priestia]|uniref:GtrA family protein n=1 Tax=Priestia TaxID=2800373 RepID=UPI0005C55DEE|nr:GtrA family protein [Priestia megaterium]RCX25703.1 putative flippase GtrA [Bacillus sp. AG236]KWU60197.1 sugar translocase [Priestia megaterium]MCP1451481.1 putative flippase GtrA [Priestia megaterium]MCU7739232.1 GtrA family protein [Priestia megaterium]MCU7744625.1 GtrA family protein [Priestia megaterium]